MNKDIFRNMGEGSRIFFLISLLFIGIVLSGVLTSAIMFLSGEKSFELLSVNTLKIMQTAQAICIFLLPALLIATIFESAPRKYLTISSFFSITQFLLILGIMISIQPLISWLGELNSQITIPETLKIAEENAQKLTERFLSDKTIMGFLSSIFVIAIVAAICEELFFRGVLQQLLTKITSNIHLGVWIGAIIFSTIHFQFYGFFPRIILGALLGYIFIWTGSIWASVCAHFLNNAIAIILSYFFTGTSIYEVLEHLDTNKNYGLLLGGSALALLLIVLLYRTKKLPTKQEFSENTFIQP